MSRCRRCAFTLIEVLVVIIIIAVLSGIAVPAYSHFWERTQFDAMTTQVTDLFAYAREQAILHDTTALVSWNAQDATLSVEVTPPTATQTDVPVAFNEGSDQNTQGPEQVPDKKSLHFPPEFSLTQFNANNGKSSLQFASDGTTEGAQILLNDVTGHSARLIIPQGSGRASVQDTSEARQ